MPDFYTALDFLMKHADTIAIGLLALLATFGYSDFRKQLIEWGKSFNENDEMKAFFDYAYVQVKRMVRKSPNKLDDKVALAVGFLREIMAQAGRTPTEVEVSKAKAHWAVKHEDSKSGGENLGNLSPTGEKE